MAKGIVDLWNVACSPRIRLDRWELGPKPNPLHNGNPNLRVFCPLDARNIDRVRGRRQGENLSPLPDAQGPLTMDDGTAIRVLPGDEIAP